MLKKIVLLVMTVSLFSAVVIAQNTAKKASKYDIDLTTIPDGTYLGKATAMYSLGKVDIEANVTVKAGKLTEIKLSKTPENRTSKPAEVAFANMIKKNAIDVDAKTAATWKEVVFDALKNKVKVK